MSNDLARQNRIMLNALRRISTNTINGVPTVSAHIAQVALRQVDLMPVPKPVAEVGISFIKLPL